MSKKYTCVMFDLDGTLLDTIDDIKHNMNLTLREFGYAEHTRDQVRSYINDGSFKLMQRALPEDVRDEENVRRVLQKYLENYDKYTCQYTKAYDGICELVHKLKQEGVTLAVVSNKPERHVVMLVDKLFDENTFSYISGTGDSKPVKPDKICVEKALQSMNKTPEEALFVGDSHVDVATAQNANLDSAGVTWGFHGKDGFLDKIPDFYIHTAQELYDLIMGKFD